LQLFLEDTPLLIEVFLEMKGSRPLQRYLSFILRKTSIAALLRRQTTFNESFS
jgi:hypothetical protein